MAEKYSCPKCGQEIDEKYVIICTCPHCHGIFDKPSIQRVPSQEDPEKKEPGEGGADKKPGEEHEELPAKTTNKVELLALIALLIISLVAYFTISRITTSKKAAQERARLVILQQQKEEENTKQEEITQAGKLNEPEGGALFPTPQPQKEEEEKKPEEIPQAEKVPEAGERATGAEKLSPETEKTLKETSLAAQKEEGKRQEGILQTQKLQELRERITSAKKLQQEAEKTLQETRLTAQKEGERQFQGYYSKGETAFQNGRYTDALESYQAALTHKPGDTETQKKISLTFAKLQYAQKIKQAESKPAKKPGTEMILIPAGEFRMGSTRNEGAAEEHPQHKVFLDAYYIDKYEVTVAQYRAFCQATGRKMPSVPSWGWNDTHPIVCVTWDDATAYANYYGNRLPTEAEWEKAARAGSTTRYYFGDAGADLRDYAWYSANSSSQTHPVGAKKPNAFGFYDMHGNAWEWCSDWYSQNYYARSPKKNPQGPASGTLRVARGGGWGYTAAACRLALRYKLSPFYWDSCLGFRCASSL